MKIFNLISCETGMIRKRITAKSYDDAVKKVEEKYNLDDYFIESIEETESVRKQQTRWWNLKTL